MLFLTLCSSPFPEQRLASVLCSLPCCSRCSSSTWVPLGDYVASNTDECTATLMYAVTLKQSGTVSFEYIYPDSSIIFEFFVRLLELLLLVGVLRDTFLYQSLQGLV